MLARARDLAEKIQGWYAAFEFHRVYHAVNEFAIVDLSSFYLDVLKDRMYTFAPTSSARRSAQTVLWKITEALARLTAPILSFTADEVWEHLPKVEGREPSVHLAQFPRPEEIYSQEPTELLEDWKQLLSIRDAVLRSLETARQKKAIGKALEAKVIVAGGQEVLAALRKYQASLKEFFNVSDVELRSHLIEQQDAAQFTVEEFEGSKYLPVVELASGHKCARCWNFMPHVSNYGVWQNVCDRCQGALREMNIAPPQADGEAA
jgi:isoleucyl-tRNA synthetase